MSRGLIFTTIQSDVFANRPTSYTADTDFALFYATDTTALYIGPRPASGDIQWALIALGAALPANADLAYNATHHTLVMANIPTADPHVAGALYSVAGVVTVSAG